MQDNFRVFDATEKDGAAAADAKVPFLSASSKPTEGDRGLVLPVQCMLVDLARGFIVLCDRMQLAWQLVVLLLVLNCQRHVRDTMALTFLSV